MKPTVLILAAGVGSRYGGLKQLDSVGPSGEVILDYSVYDALQAGFGKVVFVIRHDFEEEFKEKITSKYEGKIQVAFGYQELDDLPDGFCVPDGRTKPWGTSHAIMAAKNVIDTPFAMINADDFYGQDAFCTLATHLEKTDPKSTQWSMVAYKLGNTLSDFGGVTRGGCNMKDGTLTDIEELFKIERADDVAHAQNANGTTHTLPLDTLVSMNFFGFTPPIFDLLEDDFVAFLEERGTEMKSEYLIPTSVDEYIKSGKATVDVLTSDSHWFGVTYPEDKAVVQKNIQELVSQGKYPTRLW
jgi:dTDP-glucose pyrophosphorylase